MKDGPIKDNVRDGELRLEDGQSLPIIALGCTIDSLQGERNLNLRDGYVGEKPVKVLRDTGCELAAVRKDLVSEDQMLDKKLVMITIDGRARVVPAALIEVDTPYYQGKVEAMVLSSLICDLVLGNVKGVADTPDHQWSRQDRSGPLHETVTAAVVTRAQAEKEKRPLKALNVPSPELDNINVERLQKAQKDDTSLKKLWSYADSSKEMSTRGGNRYHYSVKKGVLYREFEQPKGKSSNTVKQVVVPSDYRKHVMSLAHDSIVV